MTTEEVQSSKELVDGCILVESKLPQCSTVEVGLDVSTQVLLDTIVYNGNAVCSEEVSSDVAGARKVSGVVSETGNIVVLYSRSANCVFPGFIENGNIPR